jgi:hypothetical protein
MFIDQIVETWIKTVPTSMYLTASLSCPSPHRRSTHFGLYVCQWCSFAAHFSQEHRPKNPLFNIWILAGAAAGVWCNLCAAGTYSTGSGPASLTLEHVVAPVVGRGGKLSSGPPPALSKRGRGTLAPDPYLTSQDPQLLSHAASVKPGRSGQDQAS